MTIQDCENPRHREHGLRVTDQAVLLVQDTAVEAAGLCGLVVDGGDVAARRCRIAKAGTGISLTPRTGVIEDCDVTGCTGAGLEIGADTVAWSWTPGSSRPARRASSSGTGRACSSTVRSRTRRGPAWSYRRRPHRGSGEVSVVRAAKNGLYLADGAAGNFEGCDLGESGFPVVYVGAGATSVLRGCRFHDADEDLKLADGATAVFRGLPAEGVKVSTLPEEAAGPGGGKGMDGVRRRGSWPPAAGTGTGAPRGTSGAATPSAGLRGSAGLALNALLAELDALIGLERVKQDVSTMVKVMQLVRRRTEAGSPRRR